MDKFVGNSREKFFFHNTLLCLVKTLKEKAITVDLRNDSYICGTLEALDGYMNLTFSNCVYCDPQGNEYLFENMFIQSRNIRYVHIPENMPILPTIQQEIHRKQKTEKEPVVKSRKAKKAFKLHMEAVAMIGASTSKQA